VIKDNPIPPDQARWDVYSKLTYENQLFLWSLLQQAGNTASPRSANQQKIGDLFHAAWMKRRSGRPGPGDRAGAAANRRPEISQRPAGFSGQPNT